MAGSGSSSSNPLACPPSGQHRFLTSLFLVFLASSAIYFTSHKLQADILVYKVGGNLRPSTKDFWEKLNRAPHVFRCAYTSCTSDQRNASQIRRRNLPHRLHHSNSTPNSCPSFFHWIYDDLAPWTPKGITKALLQRAKQFASFRVLIVNGRLFLKPYHPCYQTRALFTVWGLLQLLEFYPDFVPDVDLMFNCEDFPSISRKNFTKLIPPPVFRYCSTVDFFDIPFPDWSFWGWPEVNLGGWEAELSSILNSSKQTPWEERRPMAHWKGNPHVANLRLDLLKCNSAAWNAEIFTQDWFAENHNKFIRSKLSDQCNYRYKIYAEGSAWSVSLKYILACGSPVLSISPTYHDFFERGLVPLVSSWPVRNVERMCESIKFAVDWGNTHQEEAKAMGRAGQEYIAEDVSMKNVYDYMLQLLRQYAKLQRFKPVVPEKAAEVCRESLRCLAVEKEKAAMEQSMVKEASRELPCRLNELDSDFLQGLKERQSTGVKFVRAWEEKSWAAAPN